VPKLACTILLIALTVSGLAFVNVVSFGTARASQTVNGIITQDTTWTKTNSPYILTGPVGIPNGITLTIEPGVTLNLNKYYLVINGTLIAKGSSDNKILINGIDGSPPPVPMGSTLPIPYTYGILIHDYTGSNAPSVIENAETNAVSIGMGNGAIKNCHINGYVDAAYSSVISNNKIEGSAYVGDNSQMTNNEIEGQVTAQYGSPLISNNIISGKTSGGTGIHFESTNNIVISNNTITGFSDGIVPNGKGIIEKNLIVHNSNGISIYSSSSSTIRDNTIAQNNIGLSVSSNTNLTQTEITNNNFIENSYNVYLKQYAYFNVNVENNWWGTTNETFISQTIHDSKNDFNLGTVAFVPFLTIPNSKAPAIPTPSPAPTPKASPSPSQTPNATFNQSGSNNEVFFGLNWAEIAIVTLPSIIAVLLAVAVIFLYKRKITPNNFSHENIIENKQCSQKGGSK
jgi:parallel beta-helix repeat protein